MRNRTKAIIGGVAAAAGLAAWGGSALAAIPDSNTGVYTGCVSTQATQGLHSIYMIDKQAGVSCGNGYTQAQWNQTGPAGPTGPTGPAGATGPQGPAGPTTTYYVASGGSQQVPDTGEADSEAFCNAGDVAVSGGALASSGADAHVLRMVNSFPVFSGTTAPFAWTITEHSEVALGDTPAHFTSYVNCAHQG